MKKVICSYLVSLVLFGCNQKQSIPIYSLSDVGSTTFNLSSVLDIRNTIFLSTSDSTLLPDDFPVAQAGDFLIIFASQGIMKFNTNGEFMGMIARRGQGPLEVGFVQAYVIDSKANYLYINHQNDANSVWKYDLKNDRRVARIPFPDFGDATIHLHSIYLEDSKYLICFPKNTTRYAMFRIDTAGNFINGILQQSDKAHQFQRFLYTSQVNGSTNMMVAPDTLYALTENRLNARYIISIPQEDLKNLSNGTFDFRIILETPSRIIVQTRNRENSFENGSIRWRFSDTQVYILNREDESIQKVAGYYNDFYGLEADKFRIYTFDGGTKGVVILNASELRRQVNDLIETSTNISDELLRVYNNVSDENNPILLIGELK